MISMAAAYAAASLFSGGAAAIFWKKGRQQPMTRDGRLRPALARADNAEDTAFYCIRCVGDERHAASQKCTCDTNCGSETCMPADGSQSGWDTQQWAAAISADPEPAQSPDWSWTGASWRAPEPLIARLGDDDWLTQLLTAPLAAPRRRRFPRRGKRAVATA